MCAAGCVACLLAGTQAPCFITKQSSTTYRNTQNDYTSTYDDDYEYTTILSAVDAAVDAGVDVLAVPFSVAPGRATSPALALALANAAAQGVLTAAAVGDGGRGGVFSIQSELSGAGTPIAASPDVLAVASIDNILVGHAPLDLPNLACCLVTRLAASQPVLQPSPLTYAPTLALVHPHTSCLAVPAPLLFSPRTSPACLLTPGARG